MYGPVSGLGEEVGAQKTCRSVREAGLGGI